MTVKKIATHVRSGDPCHEYLLQALVTISYSRSTEVLKWTVKALTEQAFFPPSRLYMIAHKGLLASLIMLANDKNEFVKRHAQEVMAALAGE